MGLVTKSKQAGWYGWVGAPWLLSLFCPNFLSSTYLKKVAATPPWQKAGEECCLQALAEATRERCRIGRVAHMLLSRLQLLNLYYYSRMLPEQPFQLPNVQTKFMTMPGEGLLKIRPFKMFQPAQKCSCWDRYCKHCAHGTCMLTSWLLTILNTTLHTISSACCFECLCYAGFLFTFENSCTLIWLWIASQTSCQTLKRTGQGRAVHYHVKKIKQIKVKLMTIYVLPFFPFSISLSRHGDPVPIHLIIKI